MCARCWADHFPHHEGRRWAVRFFKVHFNARLIREPCFPRGENVLRREGSNKKVHVTGKFLNGMFWASKKDQKSSEEFYVGTPAGCVVRSTVQRQPREDAGDLVFFNSGTPWKLSQDDDARKQREQPCRIDVRPTDLSPSNELGAIQTEWSSHLKFSRVGTTRVHTRLYCL